MASDWAKRRTRVEVIDPPLNPYARRQAVAWRMGLPYFHGSSSDFVEWMRENRPDLLAPEGAIVPLDGTVGWDPSREDPDAEYCQFCQTQFTHHAIEIGPNLPGAKPQAIALHRIAPLFVDEHGKPIMPPERPMGGCPMCRDAVDAGSLLYCPKCKGTGYEVRLALQRGKVGHPPLEPKRAASPR